MTIRSTVIALALCAAAQFSAATAMAEDVTLRVVSAYPASHNFNKPLLGLIDAVNKEDKGVKLNFVGGPETLPSGEMMQALQNGVVDVFYGASSLFVGDVPEVLAVNGSNMSAMELRERGALDALSKYFEERVNARYLGYFGSGYTFYIYLFKEPKMTADGMVDLSGWSIRGGAPYRAFLDRLDANMISIFPPEMYSAMERGVIDGMIWVSVSLTGEGWEKFIKYRITPGWRQGDISLQVNLDKWNSLGDEQKALLTEKTAEYERVAHDGYQAMASKDLEALRAAGMKDIALEGEARKTYLEGAIGLLWDDMKKTVPADRVEELKSYFYKED